jgi:6-phospho-3-hexuloisomerase
LLGVYLVSSFFASIAGVIMMARFNSAKADYGQSYLLVTVLAAVLGGTSAGGGYGKVIGAMLAIVMLQMLASGGGREGLMIRALAMRLFHLGFEVSVAGDMTAPFLTKGDLLILSVGPGYVSTIDALRSVAQRDGATVVCLTAQPDGKTARAADKIVYLPAQTMADDIEGKATSVLPMGSLYELVLFVFSEIVVLELLKRTGRTFGQARDRHTNLE